MSFPKNLNVLSASYWIPKMHKSPIGIKIRIASKQCVIEPLSKNITAPFRLLYTYVQKYQNKSNFYSGVNSFELTGVDSK